MDIEFSFYFCTVMVVFSLNFFFLLVGFLLFSVVFTGGVSCVFVHLLHSSLVSVYFGRAGSLRFSLAGRVIFFFCVGLRCVECRAGTIYLSVGLEWVAGLYGFFLLLGSVEVGTVRLK